MSENIDVVPLRQPNEIDDPLTNILRSGARQLLAQAVEMEAELARHEGLQTTPAKGCPRQKTPVSRFVSGHERLFRDIREKSGLTLTLDISRHRSEATCEKGTFDEDGCYSRGQPVRTLVLP
jgi:hypothetical protein